MEDIQPSTACPRLEVNKLRDYTNTRVDRLEVKARLVESQTTVNYFKALAAPLPATPAKPEVSKEGKTASLKARIALLKLIQRFATEINISTDAHVIYPDADFLLEIGITFQNTNRQINQKSHLFAGDALAIEEKKNTLIRLKGLRKEFIKLFPYVLAFIQGNPEERLWRNGLASQA